MSNLAIQHFTDAGIDMLGQANAGALLVITKAVVGSGAAATAEDIIHRTDLISKKQDVVITRKVNLGGGKMVVSGVLTEWLMTGPAFQLRELGIMAKIGTTGTEKLYSASNVFADPPDTITPGGTSQHAFDIQIEIQRAENVSVVIDESTMIDAENIPSDPSVGPGWFAQKTGKIFQFKRAVEGVGIELTEAADRITIATKKLAVDLDLYVPQTYPGITDSNVLFPTVQAAHDYLLQFTIPPGRKATIHVAAGVFNSSSAILFNHPDSKQITLSGWARQDKTPTKVEYYNASTKKVTVPTSAWPNGTALAVGQIVYLTQMNSGWSGGCEITQVSSGFVLLSVPNRGAQSAYQLTDTRAGMRMSMFPTVLKYTGALRAPMGPVGGGLPTPLVAGSETNLNCPYGIGLIENITLKGGGYGFGLGDSSSLKNCMAITCTHRGLSNGLGVGLQGECIFTDCDFGMTGTGVIYAGEVTFVNGCLIGIAPAGAGSAIGSLIAGMDSTFVYINHCGTAIHAAAGANFRGGSIVYENNDVGLKATGGSVISLGPYASVAGNAANTNKNGLDLSAQGMSYIELKYAGPVPTSSPANDTVGNQNSLIHFYP